MILRRVTLENYCQHKSLDIEIQGNLIAVVGHNGAGKSNLMGAIQFALTGEQPGKVKESLVHWGARDGKVTLEFEAEGKPGRIVRPILSPKVTLEYDGQAVTGITAVAKAMEERLNVDRDLVRQSVFVRQKEIDTVLSAKTDRREREVAFQKLIGIDAAKMHKNLTDYLYQAVKPLNYDIQITDAEKRVGEIEARIAELEGQVAEADARLKAADVPDDGVFARTGGVIAAIDGVISAHNQLHSCKMAESKACADLQAARNDVADCGENPGVDVATKAQENQVLAEEIAKAKALCDAATRVASARVHADACVKALADAEAKAHPSDEEIAAAEEEVSELQSTLAVARSEIDSHNKALGALSGGETACPVCGKPLDWDAVERLKGELARLKADMNTAAAKVDSCRGKLLRMRKDRSDWDSERMGAESALNAARKGLADAEESLSASPHPSVDKDVAEAALAENNADIARQQAFDRKAAGRKEALQTAEIRARSAADSVTHATESLARAENAAKSALGIPDGEDVSGRDWNADRANYEAVAAAANRRALEVRDLQVCLAKATAARDEAVKTLETTRRTVSELRERQKEQDALAKRLKVLENVRDWLHYANGPRFIVKQVLAALTDDVNRFLGNFTAPFVVHPNDEDLGFIVEFTDGRDRPEKPQTTEVLSGGELVQLAVAFRFSTYCMFAGKLGLLSLDEPMAFLDTNNIGRFGVFLSKVREITRNMNVQVFVATHQQVVIPHMDSVIDLN